MVRLTDDEARAHAAWRERQRLLDVPADHVRRFATWYPSAVERWVARAIEEGVAPAPGVVGGRSSGVGRGRRMVDRIGVPRLGDRLELVEQGAMSGTEDRCRRRRLGEPAVRGAVAGPEGPVEVLLDDHRPAAVSPSRHPGTARVPPSQDRVSSAAARRS